MVGYVQATLDQEATQVQLFISELKTLRVAQGLTIGLLQASMKEVSLALQALDGVNFTRKTLT
jgi:hypothetical protein